jgi:hypothetical protein
MTFPFKELEEITWIDSAKSWSAGWYDPETIIDSAKAWQGQSTTVGFVIHEDERVVVLAQTLDDESDKVANLFLIYIPCILHRRTL